MPEKYVAKQALISAELDIRMACDWQGAISKWWGKDGTVRATRVDNSHDLAATVALLYSLQLKKLRRFGYFVTNATCCLDVFWI